MTIKELCDEAQEIIQNAYAAYCAREITWAQYVEVRDATLRDMGARAEVVVE